MSEIKTNNGLASNNGTMTGSNPVLATNKNNINLNIGDITMIVFRIKIINLMKITLNLLLVILLIKIEKV